MNEDRLELIESLGSYFRILAINSSSIFRILGKFDEIKNPIGLNRVQLELLAERLENVILDYYDSGIITQKDEENLLHGLLNSETRANFLEIASELKDEKSARDSLARIIQYFPLQSAQLLNVQAQEVYLGILTYEQLKMVDETILNEISPDTFR